MFFDENDCARNSLWSHACDVIDMTHILITSEFANDYEEWLRINDLLAERLEGL